MTADGPAFKARVRAVPSEGEANTALAQLLAAWLNVPKRSVSLASGAKSRVKSLCVEGDIRMLEARLAEQAARFLENKKN